MVLFVALIKSTVTLIKTDLALLRNPQTYLYAWIGRVFKIWFYTYVNVFPVEVFSRHGSEQQKLFDMYTSMAISVMATTHTSQ